jgi:hypothetical protein
MLGFFRVSHRTSCIPVWRGSFTVFDAKQIRTVARGGEGGGRADNMYERRTRMRRCSFPSYRAMGGQMRHTLYGKRATPLWHPASYCAFRLGPLPSICLPPVALFPAVPAPLPPDVYPSNIAVQRTTHVMPAALAALRPIRESSTTTHLQKAEGNRAPGEDFRGRHRTAAVRYKKD